MGLQKIAAKRNEYFTKAKALSKFKEAATQYANVWETFNQELDKLHKQLETRTSKMRNSVGQIEQLPTHGIPEFEQYKKHLVELYKGNSPSNRPLPFGPLDAVVRREAAAVDGLMKEWLDKAAKSVPSEIKAGMVFKHSTGNVYEITGRALVKKTPNGDVREFPVMPAEGNKDTTTKSFQEAWIRKECKFIEV